MFTGKSASIKRPKAMTIWEDIRLPTTVVPTHYDVKLKIDMTNERFTGKTSFYQLCTNFFFAS